MINFDTTTGAIGYFTVPEYPDQNFPGIPGKFGTVENFAMEVLAALEFKAIGMYSMVVNTDWTGFPNASDGYQVRAGVHPMDPEDSVVLGHFDALAPAGPTRGMANAPFQFYVSQPGIYPFRLLYYQTVGSANLEWFVLNPDGTRTLINDVSKADGITAYYQWTPPRPVLSIARSPQGLQIRFQGKLLMAEQIGGPYLQVAGATSPYTVAATNSTQFFQAIW